MTAKMKTKRTGLFLFGVVVMCALLYGCAGLMAGPVGVNGQALLGLTQERLRVCAGSPLREITQPASMLLVYYREAAMFEESSIGSKSSTLGYHHGCWATILVEEGRVSGVEFRPVPDPDANAHECQEIFAACAS